MTLAELRMAGETILIVEDEGIIAMHLQRMLTSFGFHVPQTVESGLQALECVETAPPALVLMDIQLQGEMDGIETARRIHDRYDLPIVYLSAYAEEGRLLQARQTAPYGYLTKPVQDRELRATVEMAIFKHKLDQRVRDSEASYRELYHTTPAMFHTTDPDGCIRQISDYWLSSLGYTAEEVLGRKLTDFISPNSRKHVEEVLLPEFYHNGAVFDAEAQMVCNNGRVLDVLFSMVGVYDEGGSLLHAHSALVDITARKRVEAAERDQRNLSEALRDTAAALSSTLSFEVVLERVLDNVGKVVPHDAVSIMLVEDGVARFVRFIGYKELGREERLKNLVFNVADEIHLRMMAETGHPVTFPDTSEVPGWRIDWIKSYAGAPLIVKGRLVGFLNLVGLRAGFYKPEHAYRLRAFADQVAIAIENAHLYAEVTRLATLDDVTGIINRRRLFEMGQREFERSRRYNLPLAAILLDIDHFKKINDTYGHKSGDRVLEGIAKTIAVNIREIDVFGRYGGEEFVVLLPNTTRESAIEVAERLRELVAAMNIETDRGILQVTISLGIAMLTLDIPSLATLVDHADQAMYAAKQAGRNRVEFYV